MSFLKKILFMLFSHKLSSSSTMVPFQTFLTSNPINKIILLTSTHTAHILSSMLTNVYVKVLNTLGRCQIALSLVLSLSTCFFALIFIFFSSVLFLFLSRHLSLSLLFYFLVLVFSSLPLPLYFPYSLLFLWAWH